MGLFQVSNSTTVSKNQRYFHPLIWRRDDDDQNLKFSHIKFREY